MQSRALATNATNSDRLIHARFERDDLVINLQIDADAVTGATLERLSSKGSGDSGSDDRTIKELRSAAELLSLFVKAWDADEPPTPETFETFPVGLLTDLHAFCWGEVCPFKDDLKNLRRYLVTGGEIGEAPDYYNDIKDAKLLGVRPWEINGVPMHWRLKARVVDAAEKQARARIAIKSEIPASYVLET